METAVHPVPGGFASAGEFSETMRVSPPPDPTPETRVASPAVIEHQEDHHVGDAISDPKCAFDVTVATDASAYDAGDVVSGTVTLNRVGAMKAKVRSAPAPVPAPLPPRRRPPRVGPPTTNNLLVSVTTNSCYPVPSACVRNEHRALTFPPHEFHSPLRRRAWS